MMHTTPTVRKVEGENPWTTFINKKIFKLNGCINLIVTGPPGSSKSWSLLSEFCQVDPDFDVSEQCFFKAIDLIRYFEKGNIIKGKPFLFDEAGIDASNYRWMDEVNKGLNAFFQTARHKNYCCGITVPYMDMISKGVRTLMNCHWRAVGFSAKEKISKILPYVLEYNGEISKFYRKRLVVLTDKGFTRCDSLKLPRPPDNVIKDYEKMKHEFTSKLFGEIADRMDMQKNKELEKGKLSITTKQENVLDMLREGKTVSEIATFLHCIPQNVNKKLNRLRQLGIKIQQTGGGKIPVTYIIDDKGLL